MRSSSATHAAAGQTDGLALGAVLLGAALVLLTGAVAGLLLGRAGRFRPGVAVPVAHGVVAEGEAPSVGRFRGRVEALVLATGRLRRVAEAHYLVSAPGKSPPFWVRHSDVERLRPPRQRKPKPKPQPEPSQPERRVAASPDGVRALGYVSVLAQAADEETRRLRELGAVVDSHCDARGWRLVEVVHDQDNGSGKALERPGMQYALERMARGDAARLVVPRLDVLSRSLPDLGRVIEAVRRTGGSLVVLDIGLDTASSHGELAAETVASIGEWERRRLAERTRKGLAAAKARGAVTGRPAVQDFPGLQERIAAMRSNGMTLQAIAERLNAEGVPTIRGGAEWRPSSVQAATGYRRPRKPEGGVQ